MASAFASCAILVSLSSLVGCNDSEWKEIPGRPPIAKVTFFARRVTIYPSQGVDWKTLVDMQIFDGFWPGITFSEAKTKFGEPTQTGQNNFGPFYVYRRSWGEVHVAWEEHRSGEDAYKVWTLRAYPKNRSGVDLLHPAVMEYLNVNAERVELTIMNGDPAAQILLKNSRVDSITWLR